MTSTRRWLITATAALAMVGATGCDSPDSRSTPTSTPPTASTPSSAPIAVATSNIDVRIRLAQGQLSPQQQQVVAAFTELINAQYRFWSHPWIIDPIYARTVLPGSLFNPMKPDTIGLIGPVIVQILSVETTTATQAKVTYCADDRSVRYLGRDGSIDIPGPAGDRRRGGVTLEDIQLVLTTAAAADGSTSTTPRWLASSGGLSAGAKECQVLSNSSPPPAPTTRPVTTTP